MGILNPGEALLAPPVLRDEMNNTLQETAALRDFNPANISCGVKLGHSAMSAQCPVCPKADTAERFMSITS
jgi:hypothetical protein